MNRFPLLRGLLNFLAFAVTVIAADRPNIVWITSEDNSPDYLGPYGNPHANNPTLDRLAAEGVVRMGTAGARDKPNTQPERALVFHRAALIRALTHKRRLTYGTRQTTCLS